MNEYRTDARKKRRLVVPLSTSVLRLIGFVVGPFLVALGAWILRSADRKNDYDSLVVVATPIVLIGVAFPIVLARAHPRRRLVLDEESNVARLESRSLGRWKPTWSMALDEVRRVVVNMRDIVVDTANDGRITIVRDAFDDDRAITTQVAEFLGRDE